MNKKIKTPLTVLLCCIAAMLVLAGCGAPAKDSGATAKKTINIGIMNAPSGFNPLEWSDAAQNDFTAILFQPLVELDDDMKYVPMLAESIETKDNRTFTVKLNVKAKWTDGKPVTADDVIFTLNLIANPKIASTVASNFNLLEGLDEKGKNSSGSSAIAGVKKIDDHTLALTTKKPLDIALFYEGIGKRLKTMPQHILKDIEPEKLYQSAFMQKPEVTNGPFKLITFQKGQYVHLAANKDYFKGTPKIDELYFKILPGPNITAQLQSGEIDMNDADIGLLPFDDYDKVKAMPNIVSDSSGLANAIQHLMINLETVPDVRVRKAISLAINRKMILDNLLKGNGEAVELPYFGKSPFANKSLPALQYDPQKAKQLLAEAGWDSGRVLHFDVPVGNKLREQVADIIVENLKGVGIQAQIQKYDFVTSLAKAKKGEFDLYIVGIPQTPTNPDVSGILKTGATLNLSRYSNPEMDALLAEGVNSVDPARRKTIYNQVQELFFREMPCPAVYSQTNLKAVSKRVIYGKPKAYGAYIDVYLWDVQK